MDMKQPTLWYCGLEQYPSRYSLQLTNWNQRVFEAENIPYEIVLPPEEIQRKNTGEIKTGQVLDAHGRAMWALGQTQSLVEKMKDGWITGGDNIFFEDMFHPGIEALPYIMCQIPKIDRPRVWVRCLAQTIDPDDFVHLGEMSRWMRKYEQMLVEFVDGVFVASEEMLAHLTVAGWDVPVWVTGLPFGKQEVIERVGGPDKVTPFFKRPYRVVFAARTDKEKQPDFFLDLVERVGDEHCGQKLEWAFLMGKPLSSNGAGIVNRVRSCEARGLVEVRENLTKATYYEILASSRVMFNCALQDWCSNTVGEADTLGCNVLFPAYRSFPETLANDSTRLYVPWSLEDAESKLIRLLEQPHPSQGLVSDYQDKSILRTLNCMGYTTSEIQKVPRDNPRDTSYRKRVREPKYELNTLGRSDDVDFWRHS
jgi:hypothetical protein